MTLRVCVAACLLASFASANVAARFGIITDVHYADAATKSTRHYRDSLAKVDVASRVMNNSKADFMIELGDFKDTVCQQQNKGTVSKNCTAVTLGFLDTIEEAMAAFKGPRFHVLGNHDVDILNQSAVLRRLHNYATPHAQGHYSFEMPFNTPPGTKGALRFITLNGDFNSKGEAWYDLNGGPKYLPFAWDDAWVSNIQLDWLANELQQAKLAQQKVIVFVHYRLDGGDGGPVNCTKATPCGQKNNRAWIDDCTLKNAAVVRDILVSSGVVLATFSGHDHVPIPAYTQSNGILYFTHHGMVEGPISSSNAYSVVDVMQNCTIVVTGFANATSVIHPGPPNCSIATDARKPGLPGTAARTRGV